MINDTSLIKEMPKQKSPLSTTAHTRILAALPSKPYLAMHLVLGGDAQARVKLNELARALMLQYFMDKMHGSSFLSPEELKALKPMLEVPQLDLEDQDWDDLESKFKARGKGDPNSPAYVVNSINDLEPSIF